MKKIRVVVVDDSALVRSILSAIINEQADMECIGVANDPYAAREMIRSTNPDVITLDVEMPRMDGLDFLEKLMRLRPMPVVMVSTLTERGAETTLRALELGAVDFVAKPKMGLNGSLQALGAEITDKIRVAAGARVRRPTSQAPVPSTPRPVRGPASSQANRVGSEKIVAIGASTGGTEAIRSIVCAMPAGCPAIVVTQHMPPGFTRSFADRLDSLARVRVKEAANGERLLAGHVYIAPGGHHLRVDRNGANFIATVFAGAEVNHHMPSVEVLFDSVAAHVGRNAVGVMLTGMGKDGAAAMGRMKQAGAYNIAQDEASCVVYGMPREAVRLGAVHAEMPIGEIASAILKALDGAVTRY